MDANLFLILASGLTVLIIIFYAVFLNILSNKSVEQPVRSKSPRLLFCSAVGNACSSICVCATIIIGCILSNDLSVGLDNDIMYTGICMSELIALPLVFLSYILRLLFSFTFISAVRLYNVYKDPGTVGYHNSYLLKEKFYLKILLILVGILALLGGALICFFWFYPEISSISSLRSTLELIINMLGMTLCFLASFTLSFYGLLLRRKNQTEVNMNNEVIWICLIWCFGFLALYFISFSRTDLGFFNDLPSLPFILLSAIILIRNVGCFIVSIVVPVLIKPDGAFIPYCETQECAKNVEIALKTELPHDYFVKYIKSDIKGPGVKLIELHDEIKNYERMFDNEDLFEQAKELSMKIIQNYIHPCAVIQGIPEKTRESILDKSEHSPGRLDRHLFDGVYGVIINSIQEYFKTFQLSNLYSELKAKLVENEETYARLSYAKLI